MQAFLKNLEAFAPQDEQEAGDQDRTAALVRDRQDCFYRTCFDPGHVTGSGLLVDSGGGRVLMNRHKALGKWLCFGGHADGSADILSVARREVVEESGIGGIEPVSTAIFDIDVHPIPENPAKKEPAHAHFDIRYLFRTTGDETYVVSDESLEMRWCGFEEALSLLPPAGENGMRRLLLKWKRWHEKL